MIISHTESRDRVIGTLLFQFARHGCALTGSEVQKMKKGSRKYKWSTYLLMILGVLGLGAGSFALLRSRIPEQIQVSGSGETPQVFHSAWDSVIASSKSGSQIEYSLFGKIPLKTVNVSVVPRKQVYLGGTPIGIYLETDGVFVVETGKIKTGDGSECCPSENIIKSGDYIQAVDGEKVETKEELITCISQCQGKDIVLAVERDGKQIDLKLHPVQDENGKYRAGIWVRNDTQGIGTLTYIDEDGNFGALGHGISDVDTGDILNISEGELYDAEVISIVKGVQGTPGELAGVIHYSDGYRIGTIRENRQNGIYGTITSLPAYVQHKKVYETAYRQEIEEGKAAILSSVSGTEKEYGVEIKEVRLNGKDVNKGMILEVTDEELLELTGGIVQGMSGSPIIQNGRLIGAVTHVFVNDPTRGYGIFIEEMLDAVG